MQLTGSPLEVSIMILSTYKHSRSKNLLPAKMLQGCPYSTPEWNVGPIDPQNIIGPIKASPVMRSYLKFFRVKKSKISLRAASTYGWDAVLGYFPC